MINKIILNIEYTDQSYVTETFSNLKDAIDFLQAEWEKAEEEDSKV